MIHKKTAYIFIFFFTYFINAYTQSFKLYDDVSSPILKEAIKAHRREDMSKADSLYNQYNDYVVPLSQELTIRDSAYFSNINLDDLYTDMLIYCYTAGVYYIQSGKPENLKTEIIRILIWGLDKSLEYKGKDHILHAYLLTLGAYFADEPNAIEEFHLRAIRIYKEQLGDQHITYADEVSRLAEFYLKREDFIKAEALLSEIKSVFESYYEKNDWDYISFLIDFMDIHLGLKNYKKAIEVIDEILVCLKMVDYVDVSSILAQHSLLKEMIPFLEGLTTIDKTVYSKLDSVKVIAKKIGSINDSYIQTLVSLGYDAFLSNKIEDSNSLYYEALGLEESKNGKGSPLYQEISEALKINSSPICRKEKLEYLLENNKFNSGVYHQSNLNFMYALLELYLEEESWDKATDLIRTAQDILVREADYHLISLSENERVMWWQSSFYMRMLFSYIPMIYAIENNWSLVQYAYDYELFSKSTLLSSAKLIKDAIFASNDPALINQWEVLSEFKKNENLTNEEEMQRLEKSILQKVPSYNELKSYLELKWYHIKDVLEPNEVAIEFIQIIDIEDKSKDAYMALLLRSDYDYPETVLLCSINDFSKAIHSKEKDALYETIWQPLEKYLENEDIIYIAPTGLLHTVSFGGLSYGDGKYYLCEDYTIHNLLTTKDIIKLKSQNESSSKQMQIALFGGADYILPANELALLDKSIKNINENNLTRSLLDEMDPLRGTGFSYLPGSKREVQQIDKHLANLNWKTTLFVDQEATEGRFKSFSSVQSPEVIHLSTHGFYFPQPQSDSYNDKVLLSMDNSKSGIYRLSDNPLMRSGLAFTGANHVWNGNDPIEGIDDGILTAYEISNLNLFNTELVVLSACNTGLGDIDHSEGVYGLQRAFRLAGVQTMIVSLWEVPDKETVELMTEFYTLWGEGMTKKQAFDKAQLKMRYTYPNQPEKWAGFIMIE